MLNDTQIKRAKPKEADYRLHDYDGLFIIVKAQRGAPTKAKAEKGGGRKGLVIGGASGKYWRVSYRFQGKRNTLSAGTYPSVSLADARKVRDEIRAQVKAGIDPSAARRVATNRSKNDTTFLAVAREWHETKSSGWSASHSKKVWRRIEKDVLPYLGQRPIESLGAPEILETMRRIEARGAIETAHRCLQSTSSVFQYAVQTGKAPSNPARELSSALKSVKSTHMAAITDPVQVGGLLRAIAGYESPVTRAALQLLAYTFVRPGELRQSKWAEFDFADAMWRIPAERMKRRIEHTVPLSKQAINVLQGLQPLTCDGEFVFPSVRTNRRCMSDNTLPAALRNLGYTKDQMSAHGFRSVASSLLNEQGWNPDVIERQLSHMEGNKVRAAYNRGQYVPERVKMMQQWADYLDSLREGGKVISIRSHAT